jgi:hypothetical protein
MPVLLRVRLRLLRLGFLRLGLLRLHIERVDGLGSLVGLVGALRRVASVQQLVHLRLVLDKLRLVLLGGLRRAEPNSKGLQINNVMYQRYNGCSVETDFGTYRLHQLSLREIKSYPDPRLVVANIRREHYSGVQEVVHNDLHGLLLSHQHADAAVLLVPAAKEMIRA